MWRLLYGKTLLKKAERRQLELELDGLSFTCGSSVQDLDLPAPLNERSLKCFDHVEKLYYSAAGYEPIRIHCAGKVQDVANTLSVSTAFRNQRNNLHTSIFI